MVNRLKSTFGALALLGVSANGGVAQEFVDVELTRLDGSTMTRNYEKPRYGGTITMNREILLVSFRTGIRRAVAVRTSWPTFR